jgi:hypothetical protein
VGVLFIWFRIRAHYWAGVDQTKNFPVSVGGRKFLECWNTCGVLKRHQLVVEIFIKK